MGIRWQDRVTSTAVLEKAGSLRMEDGRIPKDLLYGQLASGCRPEGCPALRYKDVYKRDLKLTDINPDGWEKLADDRDGWRLAVRDGVRSGEEKRNLQLENKRTKRKERQQTADTNQPSTFACNNCGRDCHARIGLLSHIRRCAKQKDWPNRAHTIVFRDWRMPTKWFWFLRDGENDVEILVWTENLGCVFHTKTPFSTLSELVPKRSLLR